MKFSLLAAVISVAVAYALTPIVRAYALKWDIVARPGGRRVHARPTPLMGGIAMYAGFITAVIAIVALHTRLSFDKSTIGLLISGSMVAVVGVLDDKYELPGWAQAVTILIAAATLTLFGVRIEYITKPWVIRLGVLSIPVTMIWILMVTKAVDCMDGLDGLAAGISAIASATLMLMGIVSGREMSAVMAAALLGGTLGFLRYNYPPAKIFMGTVGAQFLGFMLASISIIGALKTATMVAVAAPVLILGVPLFDTTFVVLKRMLSGKKIGEADTSHLHHRLVGKGLSHRQVIWAIYAITFVFCAAAYALFTCVK